MDLVISIGGFTVRGEIGIRIRGIPGEGKGRTVRGKKQVLVLIQGIGIKLIKRVKQKRQGVVCKFVPLLEEGGIGGGTDVVREKFEQFIPYGTGFHGNDKIQQGGEIQFTFSGEIGSGVY